MSTADELDPYRVLGVEPTASLLDIARARRRLAKLHHPDLVAGDAAAAEMGRINAAWAMLADAEARSAWDAANRRAPVMPSASSTWTEWAYPPPPPRPAVDGRSSGNAGWWVLAAVSLLLITIVVGGVVSTLDRPEGMRDPAPWLQTNLDP